MDRQAALALLTSQHEFPGVYSFRVVVRSAETAAVVAAMGAAGGEAGEVRDVRERPSRKGTYVALHVFMYLPSAEAVLDIYEVLRRMDGVMTSM